MAAPKKKADKPAKAAPDATEETKPKAKAKSKAKPARKLTLRERLLNLHAHPKPPAA